MAEVKLCSVEGCGGAVFSRGWCSKHYTRWQRHGDPHTTLRNPPVAEGATEKRCPRCCNVLPLSSFSKRPSGKPKGYCKSCESAYQRQHADSAKGREQHRQARAKWNDNNYGYFLEYRYGITIEEYDQMVADQGNKCAICGADEPGCGKSRWSVDHCHSSFNVRGLLCASCNTGLGYFSDNPERLRAAASYLET